MARWLLLAALCLPAAGYVLPAAPLRHAPATTHSAPPQRAVLLPASAPHAPVRSRHAAPTMGLFGLGAPELAIIAGVAMVILGPDQMKKLAKEAGKASAELKQVPEQFNKGMEAGKEEMEARKAEPPEEGE